MNVTGEIQHVRGVLLDFASHATQANFEDIAAELARLTTDLAEVRAENARLLDNAKVNTQACATWAENMIAELERAKSELQTARETNNRLNRRCSKAESIVAISKVLENRPQGAQGRSFGRALANYAASENRRLLVEAKAESAQAEACLVEIRALLPAEWAGVEIVKCVMDLVRERNEHAGS